MKEHISIALKILFLIRYTMLPPLTLSYFLHTLFFTNADLDLWFLQFEPRKHSLEMTLVDVEKVQV